MTQPQKNTALAFASVAGLISLPLTWMNIRGATIQGGFGDMFNSAFVPITIDVTGLNGHVTFLFETPLWLIIGVAIAASLLQLMRNSKMFAIPRFAEWLTAIVAVAWISLAVIVALFSGTASLGIGCLFGLASAVIPVICLAVPARGSGYRISRTRMIRSRRMKRGVTKQLPAPAHGHATPDAIPAPP